MARYVALRLSEKVSAVVSSATMSLRTRQVGLGVCERCWAVYYEASTNQTRLGNAAISSPKHGVGRVAPSARLHLDTSCHSPPFGSLPPVWILENPTSRATLTRVRFAGFRALCRCYPVGSRTCTHRNSPALTTNSHRTFRVLSRRPLICCVVSFVPSLTTRALTTHDLPPILDCC